MIPRQKVPGRIGRLEELAGNLWWSWDNEARGLFRVLDYPLWRFAGHNPVRMLREISAEKLLAASQDAAFLSLYDRVIAAFDEYLAGENKWFSLCHKDELPGPVAYLSPEFAIHNSLPIYAGGLGILAGDVCKEASDLGLPFVGVGFMYPQGYFLQRITAEGWQQELYQQLDFDEAPIRRVFSPDGTPLVIQVEIAERTIAVGVWRVKVGDIDIYLLDTGIETNSLLDRSLSARLYTADRDQRLQQEIVLGVGGVRTLRALGIEPSIWHANEGHAAFMMFERIREYIARGLTFDEALNRVRETTVFTTHTPVPAGHDVFPDDMMLRYFSRYFSVHEKGPELFLGLGHESAGEHSFNMTVLALKASDYRNAVSRIHGVVTRKMWHNLWPELLEEKVPITHVTNGIHVPTWVGREMAELFEKYLGKDWVERQDDPELWKRVWEIPDEELWAVHDTLKHTLINFLDERCQQGYAARRINVQQCVATGALLAPETLTIGIVRRFARYKRPELIFSDPERLKKILRSPLSPMQVVFAGKAHPADFPAKQVLHDIYSRAMDSEFEGRIAFVEDYSMHVARYLVQGVDVWLNMPQRLHEASGTSGMKASLNGVPHFSISDGWWCEGYNGKNGWKIGDDTPNLTPEEQDKADAESLYEILEKEIIPLYYQRDRRGVPVGWVRAMKETISSVVPVFCARRMVKEYAEKMYLPASTSLRVKEAAG